MNLYRILQLIIFRSRLLLFFQCRDLRIICTDRIIQLLNLKLRLFQCQLNIFCIIDKKRIPLLHTLPFFNQRCFYRSPLLRIYLHRSLRFHHSSKTVLYSRKAIDPRKFAYAVYINSICSRPCILTASRQYQSQY